VGYYSIGDQAGPLGEKWRPLVRKDGECDVKSRHLQGCSPHLCWLRIDGLVPHEQVLNVPIIYWYIGPVNLVACHRQKLDLSLLLYWLWGGRETWWGCRSVSRRVGDVVESPYFLGAVGSIQIYRWLVKGYYMWTTWDTYDRGSYVDRAWKACGVLVGFSLAECTSIRITVNLGYEYCLFVAVIT
jgi:hypothetical protein